jgi:hypothetical protein
MLRACGGPAGPIRLQRMPKRGSRGTTCKSSVLAWLPRLGIDQAGPLRQRVCGSYRAPPACVSACPLLELQSWDVGPTGPTWRHRWLYFVIWISSSSDIQSGQIIYLFWSSRQARRNGVVQFGIWGWFMGHSCQCLALFTLGRRYVPSRKVEAALCIKDVGHGNQGNCDFISMMGNLG